MVELILVAAKKTVAHKASWNTFLESGADKIAVDLSAISYWQGGGTPAALEVIKSFNEAEQRVKKLKVKHANQEDGVRHQPDLVLILPFDFLAPSKERMGVLAKFATMHIKQFLFQVNDKGKLPTSEKKWKNAADFAKKYESLLVLPWHYYGFGSKNDKMAEKQAKALITWQEKVRKNGFKGILFHCVNMPVKNRASAIAALVDLIHKTKEYGLQVGFIGALQEPDIPRLLPFSPDYLAFNEKNDWGFRQIKIIPEDKILPAKIEKAGQKAEGFFNLDKILVSNFIIPMHIGAYTHEKKAAQRVSFNVITEVFSPVKTGKAKLSGKNPVFSYDIILDAIRRIASEGHKELVETVAEQLADFLLSFPQLAKVTVRVEKLDLAPCAVGIEITRSKTQNFV